MVPVEIRRLEKTDDRSAFCCGDAALDRHFQHYAGQNQFKLRLSVTYVATLGSRILGFATVAGGSLERQAFLDPEVRERFPAYPLPVLRLARMGVDRAAQGLGVGTGLLQYVFRLALVSRDTTGCLGVVVDAKPGAVPFYARLGFNPLSGIREGYLHGDAAPMFLGVETLAAAVGPDTQR